MGKATKKTKPGQIQKSTSNSIVETIIEENEPPIEPPQLVFASRSPVPSDSGWDQGGGGQYQDDNWGSTSPQQYPTSPIREATQSIEDQQRFESRPDILPVPMPKNSNSRHPPPPQPPGPGNIPPPAGATHHAAPPVISQASRQANKNVSFKESRRESTGWGGERRDRRTSASSWGANQASPSGWGGQQQQSQQTFQTWGDQQPGWEQQQESESDTESDLGWGAGGSGHKTRTASAPPAPPLQPGVPNWMGWAAEAKHMYNAAHDIPRSRASMAREQNRQDLHSILGHQPAHHAMPTPAAPPAQRSSSFPQYQHPPHGAHQQRNHFSNADPQRQQHHRDQQQKLFEEQARRYQEQQGQNGWGASGGGEGKKKRSKKQSQGGGGGWGNDGWDNPRTEDGWGGGGGGINHNDGGGDNGWGGGNNADPNSWVNDNSGWGNTDTGGGWDDTGGDGGGRWGDNENDDDGWDALTEETYGEQVRHVHFSPAPADPNVPNFKPPVHASGRASKAFSPGGSGYPMTSRTMAHAYAGTTGSMNPAFAPPANPMNDYANVNFVDSKGAGLMAAQQAFFGKSRLAKNRIHWMFPPEKDERVSSLLDWISAMSYPLGMYGLHRFLQSREKGALFVNADYRPAPKSDEPAFDWLTFDQLQITMDKTLQESVAFYDPAVQTIVFVFLPSETGNSVAVWRRKIKVPNNARLAYGREIQLALNGLRREQDYVVHVDEVPSSKIAPPALPTKNKLLGRNRSIKKKGLPLVDGGPVPPKKKKKKWWNPFSW